MVEQGKRQHGFVFEKHYLKLHFVIATVLSIAFIAYWRYTRDRWITSLGTILYVFMGAYVIILVAHFMIRDLARDVSCER